MKNNFYVYEYIRLDYNEPFYIGKGSNNRWKELNKSRSKHFKNIIKNIPVACIILHDNLDEQTAFEYECWYIWQLRDIQGYNLINLTDGGEGTAGHKHTKESIEKMKVNSTGKTHTLETKKKMSDKKKGYNNPSAKPVYFILKDSRMDFKCRKDMENYLSKKYNCNGAALVKKLLKTGEEYRPKKLKMKDLYGLKCFYK